MAPGGVLRTLILAGALALWVLWRWSRRGISAGTWALVLTVGANLVSSVIRRGSKPGGLWTEADPRLIVLLTNITIVASLFGLVLFREYITGTQPSLQRLRRPIAIAAAAIGLFLMCTVWAVATGDPMELYNTPEMSWPAGLFAIAGRAYMAWVFAETSIWAWRWLRHASPITRFGLVLVGIGTALLALATTVDTAAAVISLTGNVVPDTHSYVATSDTIGGLTLIAGILLPVVLGRLVAAVVWLHSWWTHRRLEPLWRIIRVLYPELVLDVPSTDGLGTAERRRFLLRRRITECSDGLARLTGSPAPPQTPLATELAELARKHHLNTDRGDTVSDDLSRAISADTRRLIQLSSDAKRTITLSSTDSASERERERERNA